MLNEVYYEEEHFNNESDIDFEKGEFIECSFEKIDFTNSSIKSAKFIECRFVKCNLSNSSILNTVFRDIHFKECRISGVIWSEANTLSEMKFEESLLDFSSFQGLKISATQFLN